MHRSKAEAIQSCCCSCIVHTARGSKSRRRPMPSCPNDKSARGGTCACFPDPSLCCMLGRRRPSDGMRTRRDSGGRPAARMLLYIVSDDITIVAWVDQVSPAAAAQQQSSHPDPPADDRADHFEPADDVRDRRRPTDESMTHPPATARTTN
jgi:hypothetical protein|uniref:Uncharacterized protein n=1 Tax=Zea mays TaxID=4577 RepID=A0A804QER9_MAIZE